MLLNLLLATVYSVGVTANAKNDCTSQLQGYIAGLETGAAMEALTTRQRNKAIKQIDYIKKLQDNFQDCEVIDFIPELKATKDALNLAGLKMKNM